jgi:hypothetical protein
MVFRATVISLGAVRTYQTELLVDPQSVGSSLDDVALEVSMLSVNGSVVILVALLKSSLAGLAGLGLVAAAGAQSTIRAKAIAMVIPA